MAVHRISWKSGLLAGLRTTWLLGKIIFPVTFIITVLGYTPILQAVINFIAPLMKWLGLPGEAAVPLVLGNALNLYAGIAGILSLELTVKEVFIIAVMLSFSHNLFIESGVATSVGVKLWVVLVVRIGLAVVSAFVINLVWSGGGDIAQYGLVQPAEPQANGFWEIAWFAVEKATLAIIFLVACHAVVEDTLIFVPLGIPILPLLIIRIVVAVALTITISRLWNRAEMAKRKEETLTTYEHER